MFTRKCHRLSGRGVGLQEIHTACQENKAVPRAAPRDPAVKSTMTLGVLTRQGSSPLKALASPPRSSNTGLLRRVDTEGQDRRAEKLSSRNS